MHGLFGEIEPVRDLTPGPPQCSCALDLREFELFSEPSQLGCRAKSHTGIDTCGLFPEFGGARHNVNLP